MVQHILHVRAMVITVLETCLEKVTCPEGKQVENVACRP